MLDTNRSVIPYRGPCIVMLCKAKTIRAIPSQEQFLTFSKDYSSACPIWKCKAKNNSKNGSSFYKKA